MEIQVLDVQAAECIAAYCNQKMQVCTVEQILEFERDNILLLASTFNNQ